MKVLVFNGVATVLYLTAFIANAASVTPYSGRRDYNHLAAAAVSVCSTQPGHVAACQIMRQPARSCDRFRNTGLSCIIGLHCPVNCYEILISYLPKLRNTWRVILFSVLLLNFEGTSIFNFQRVRLFQDVTE